MKHKVKPNQQERGITLIALIITIIVLVILAAVTLNSIFGNNIIGIAINGAMGYAEEQQKELGMLNNVSGILSDFLGDSNKPMAPSVTLEGTKGNNEIYTSDVTANISINRGLETTGTIKLHYSLSGDKTQEEQVVEEDVSIQITEEGTTTITAWTENDKGNLSDKVETVVTINKTAPSTPTISLNGTNGENGYYISDVGVTISAGETATDVSRIKYKVEGANPIAETESAGNGDVTFNITQDGRSTVTAYIINTAGLTSDTITQDVNKDETNPSAATIALSGEAGETNINVLATGEDVTSGVGSYIFQISTTGNEDDFQTADTVVNEANSCTYQYDELTANTTYYLRVIVKDKAGNTIASNIVNTKTNREPFTIEELALKIGEYVDYKPTSGSFTSEGQYNGGSNQSFSTDTSLKWKILFADSNKLTLISDKSVHNGFYLQGANGYNNGVLLLNNACKAMYSNSSLGATGRSLKIEDIESVSSFKGTDFSSDYGKEYSASSRYYPNIFAQEEGGAPNGTYGSLGRSEQSSYVTGSSSGGSSFKGRETWYSYTMSSSYMNQKYVTLFNCSPTSWLASRCVNFYSEAVGFLMFYVSGGTVDAGWLYYSHSIFDDNASYAVRPVVEIDLTKVNVGLTGDGGAETPFSIEAK